MRQAGPQASPKERISQGPTLSEAQPSSGAAAAAAAATAPFPGSCGGVGIGKSVTFQDCKPSWILKAPDQLN